MQHLSKEEFIIYLKYLALAQQGYTITIESLKNNYQKIESPIFSGVSMPPKAAPKSNNPFDDFGDDDEAGDDDGFDGFQDAKSINGGIASSTGSNGMSIHSAPI
jgi:hypothetical protein